MNRLEDDQQSSGKHFGDKELIKQEELCRKRFLEENYSFKWNEVVWRNVILLSLLHIAAVYAWLLFMIDPTIHWQTSVATFVFGLLSSSLGITAGAHRLWSHRSYKAKWPLRFVDNLYSMVLARKS